jgi:hypothetical protein
MHDIRRYFHEQLRELWKLDARLARLGSTTKTTHDNSTGKSTTVSGLDEITEKYDSGIEWIPLVSERAGIACGLNILFLRREPKGGIIQSGDLDNRINTLFDALRIPDKQQIPDSVDLTKEPTPFYCLLSNDKLIAEFRITADRLLVPSANAQGAADVHLVIEVRTFITDYEKAAWSLMADAHK